MIAAAPLGVRRVFVFGFIGGAGLVRARAVSFIPAGQRANGFRRDAAFAPNAFYAHKFATRDGMRPPMATAAVPGCLFLLTGLESERANLTSGTANAQPVV